MCSIGVTIPLILSFPHVGNRSQGMFYTEQYSRAKKDSGQAGMTSEIPRFESLLACGGSSLHLIFEFCYLDLTQ
jgi:hypothetical protein